MGNAFPDVYATTYIDGNTPAVKAADLNALQLEEIRLWRALRGSSFLIGDDFCSDSLNRGIWKAGTAGVSLTDDTSNGGAGAAVVAASAGDTGPTLITNPILPASSGLAWRLSARVRTSGFIAAGSIPHLGMLYASGTPTTGVGFTADSGTGTWWARINGSTEQDTLVPVDSTYRHFEVRFDGTSVFEFYVDGVLKKSITGVPYAAGTLALGAKVQRVSTNDATLYVDEMKLHVFRDPVALAIGGAATGTHTEKFPSTWLVSDTSKSFTFATPFADTSYDVFPSLPYISGGGAAPSFVVTAKSTTGFTVAPSDVWAGSVTFTVQ